MSVKLGIVNLVARFFSLRYIAFFVRESYRKVSAFLIAAVANAQYDKAHILAVVHSLNFISVLMNFGNNGFFGFGNISNVAARYIVRKIAIIAVHTNMARIAKTVGRCGYKHVQILMSFGLYIVRYESVAAIVAGMVGITVGYARCRVYRFSVGVSVRLGVVRDITVCASCASVGCKTARQASRLCYYRFVGMSERVDIVIEKHIFADRTGMLGITSFGTSGCNFDFLIIVSDFVRIVVRILIAAYGTEMRRIAFMSAGIGYDYNLERMSLCAFGLLGVCMTAVRTRIQRISRRRASCRYNRFGVVMPFGILVVVLLFVTAVRANIFRIALFGTRCRDFRKFVFVVTYLVCARRACRSEPRAYKPRYE